MKKYFKLMAMAVVAMAAVTFSACNADDDFILDEVNTPTQLTRSDATTSAIINFEKPSDGRDFFVFNFGETKTLKLTVPNGASVKSQVIPEGWSISFLTSNSLSVSAPAAESGVAYKGGDIELVFQSTNGIEYNAKAPVCASIDYTDIEGTFVVCEGNMSDSDGILVYYDKDNNEYLDVFRQANSEVGSVGNVLQDMYMANDRIYFITQNGDRRGGAGRFVVCDARTMRMLAAHSLSNLKTPNGDNTWPQHLVVTSGTKAFVQYSDSNMEQTSGIVELTLGDYGKTVTIGNTINGTFGAFTSAGATKTRMVYSRGKIYAGCGYRVVIINPATATVDKTLTFDGQQVKGIVKGSDNNIYFALAGTFTGGMYNPTFTSRPQIVCINHTGTILSKTDLPEPIELPVASWSPAINMCASFTEPYLYFVDTDDFSAKSAARYNISTKKADAHFISGNKTLYGIMGQHVTTNDLWVCTSSYTDSDIYRYKVVGSTLNEIACYHYPARDGASPAGVDFTYRFSTEYIDK